MTRPNNPIPNLEAARFLRAECDVRYWEDAVINGQEDVDGDLLPCRQASNWVPVIDIHTGIVEGWPSGTVANIHFKVCDAGLYQLLDQERKVLAEIEGYVPKMMCPGGMGFGDYVIMDIDAEGRIAGWHLDISPFENS